MSIKILPHQPLKIPLEAKIDACQKLYWSWMAVMCRSIHAKYGEEGLACLFDGLRAHMAEKGAELAIAWGLPPEKIGSVNPEELIQMLDTGDSVAFSMTTPRVATVSDGVNQLIYDIQSCNVGDTIASIFPRTCSVVSRAAEQGLADAVNPNIKVSGCEYRSEGCNSCKVVFTVKDESQVNMAFANREAD
jgi:hypothetical protein